MSTVEDFDGDSGCVVGAVDGAFSPVLGDGALDDSGTVETNFPASCFLPEADTNDLLSEFAAAGLAGGALYDGLVGAAARKHKLLLVTCDRRAEPTYRVLGVNYELLSPISRQRDS